MGVNKCDKCNRIFASKYNLDRHMKRKIPCNEKDIKKFECVYCYNDFSTNGNLKRHLKKCKVKISKEKEEKLEKLNYEIKEKDNLINGIKLELDEFKEEIKQYVKNNNSITQTDNSITNNNNNNNNTVINNYNFVVNDYRKPNIEGIFTEDNAIKRSFVDYVKENRVNTPTKMVPIIWGDINKPENHSMLLTNPRSDYMSVMIDNEWRQEEVFTVLKYLHNFSYMHTINTLKELRKSEEAMGMQFIHNLQMLINNMEKNRYDVEYFDENLKHFLKELINIKDKVEPTIKNNKKHKKIQYEQSIDKIIREKAS